mmetsp:Transcript_14812/g.45769  ORF Transcript_14812/g.45769 Transcript_14812/m.45769 type:complete len:473 (+) Transcript_14812:320-1738(+)
MYVPPPVPVLTQQNGPLPPGWQQELAPDGRVYYIDHNTKQTSWTRPAPLGPTAVPYAQPVAVQAPPPVAVQAPPPVAVVPPPVPIAVARPRPPPPPPPSASGLPPHWERKTAPDGRTYYVDHRTKTTHWQLPTTAPVAGAPIVVPATVVSGPGAGGPIMPTGTRRALLIGCNYPKTSCALRGCVNDAVRMRELLRQQGFPDSGIRLLRDDRRTSYTSSAGGELPTKQNIISGLRWLVNGAARGDALFFHFSGHGAQQRDTTGDEADGYDETILPCDFKRTGQITDDDLFKIVVKDLPEGCKLTAIMDCCHSGTGLDLPFNYVQGRGWQCEEVPFHTRGDVQMFSGCEDDQCSADTVQNYQAGGAMTNAFLQALADNPMPLYPDFLAALHRNLNRKGHRQRPQLSSTQRFDLRDRVFHVTEGFVPNHNTTFGVPPGARRTKPVRRRKRRSGGMGLEGMMAAGMGVGILSAFMR